MDLTHIHPKLVDIIIESIVTYPFFRVTEGVRTIEKQKEYVAKGASKTMNSKHLIQPDGWAHAFDVVPLIKGKVSWEWEHFYPLISGIGKVAVKQNTTVVWGGVWDRALNDLDLNNLKKEVDSYAARQRAKGKKPFLDGPHIELKG